MKKQLLAIRVSSDEALLGLPGGGGHRQEDG